MNYEEVKIGARVKVTSKVAKWREIGVVVDKQQQWLSGAAYERVWVDTPRGGRRICVPSVLERVDDDPGDAA